MPPLPPAPKNWASDELSAFLDAARVNEYATFVNLPSEAGRLIRIDQCFRSVVNALNNSAQWFSGFFLLRSHSNFLAATRMIWSGQLPEGYALMRSCLESTLYGVYLSSKPASREIWLHREDNEAAKKAVRKEFRIPNLLTLAKQLAPQEGQVAQTLYDRTIDQGAHPNELALMQTLKIEKEPEHLKFSVAYLQGNGLPLEFALKSLAQVGVCSLGLFEHVLPERYANLGINDTLLLMKRGL